MPRIVREAAVEWRGSLARGSGVATAATGAFELPVDLPSRVGQTATRTSPEELLAAAHATCYALSLAGEVASAGGDVEQLEVRCTITMNEVSGKGHVIVASDIDAKGRVSGLDGDGFRQVAGVADAECPFSALIRASATVTVQATLDGGEGGRDGG